MTLLNEDMRLRIRAAVARYGPGGERLHLPVPEKRLLYQRAYDRARQQQNTEMKRARRARQKGMLDARCSMLDARAGKDGGGTAVRLSAEELAAMDARDEEREERKRAYQRRRKEERRAARPADTPEQREALARLKEGWGGVGMSETLEIEAIPTRYRDTRGRVVQCRSRLEFRWLLWLDCLSIPWDYEPATFSIEDKAYLPDLFLTREEAWVELKPAGWEPDHQRYGAFVRVVMEPLLVIAGPPRFGGYRITLYRPDVPREDGMVFACGRRDASELWLASLESGVAVALSPRSSRMNWPTHTSHALKQAYLAASTYQFKETS